MDTTTEDKIKSLLAQWGYEDTAPEEMHKNAALSVSLQGLVSGQAIVRLQLATQEQIDTLLRDKPANVLSMEYLSEKIPGLRAQMPRLLALLHGIPYLKSLTGFELHPAMTKNERVKARCDELNAVLVSSTAGRPLLLFADHATLSGYAAAGRIEKLEDPIRKELEADPLCGIAESTQLSKLGKSSEEELAQRVVSAASQDNFWASVTARTDGERILTRLLDNAIARKATDIDIMPLRDGTAMVRIRVHGDLVLPDRHDILAPEVATEITRFLISRSRAGDGGRLREPADGQMTYKNASDEVNMRCSFIPADRFGLDFDMITVSARLLPRTTRSIYLDDLNLPAIVKEEVLKALMGPPGLIVLSGPTNSGKSTTIAGIAGEYQKINGISKKLLSLEDPVERHLEGIMQIPVNNNFAKLVRAALRHDPDLVWVGEIRDSASSNACVRAATSGHVVLSTVHANNSILAFQAIANYLSSTAKNGEGSSASRFDLAESLSLLIGQRLVKKLCPHCKQEHAPAAAERKAVLDYIVREGQDGFVPRATEILEGPVFRAKEGGCALCAGSGYGGERPVVELLPVSRTVKDLFLEHDNKLDFSALAKHRPITLLQSSMALVAAGEVSLTSAIV
jgi:type II secretory ATPase GspE/PulE/Tfp pilus assembly ATPase PilB-like protein